MMEYKVIYHQYLQSDKWKTLRELVMKRSSGSCELCGLMAEHVHHIKYPKNYNDDNINNLLAVCKKCHDKLHGHYTFKDNELSRAILDSLLDKIYNYMIRVDVKDKNHQWYICIKDIYNNHLEQLIKLQGGE